ncbi:hypothetical protein [Jeotgalibacillus salarius]|uniref:Uncharacterized protein n=1 Tax=Jeotgalibacillus salarius TaxID=546023 RepID=A0A4Y8LJM0_9BACL|nr:hypothetical protein [Jeotgalibacillus salarius]TFE02405.1 hypothetical protein E2626_07460 [Jeotgalibacillus salarius]
MGLGMSIYVIPKIKDLSWKETIEADQFVRRKETEEPLYQKVKHYRLPIPYSNGIESIFRELVYWRNEHGLHWWFIDELFNGIDPNPAVKIIPPEKIIELHQNCCEIISQYIKSYHIPSLQINAFLENLNYENCSVYEFLRSIEYMKEITQNGFLENHYFQYQSTW